MTVWRAFMRIRFTYKVLVAFGMLVAVGIMAAGALTQIGQGHFLNPPDVESHGSHAEPALTLSEKVAQARRNLNFGK